MSDVLERYAADTPTQCGYCGWEPDAEEGWRMTPHGRHACPDCGAIPADEQRDDEVVA